MQVVAPVCWDINIRKKRQFANCWHFSATNVAIYYIIKEIYKNCDVQQRWGDKKAPKLQKCGSPTKTMQRTRRNGARKGETNAPTAAAVHAWTTATSAKSPAWKERNSVEIRLIMYNKDNKGRWNSSPWLTYKLVNLGEISIRGQ